MNLYEKLGNIQLQLLDTEISKSGHNKFGNFKHYELNDLLPPIIRLCGENKCVSYFSTEENDVFLHLVDLESENSIVLNMTMPPLEKLAKMNLMQSKGAYITYVKRYLLLNLFNIVDTEIIDSLNQKDNSKRNLKPNSNVVPEPVQEAIKKLNAKGVEITRKALENHVNLKKMDTKTRKSVIHYLKNMDEGV